MERKERGQHAGPVGPPNIPTVPARGEASACMLFDGTILRYASNVKFARMAYNERVAEKTEGQRTRTG